MYKNVYKTYRDNYTLSKRKKEKVFPLEPLSKRKKENPSVGKETTTKVDTYYLWNLITIIWTNTSTSHHTYYGYGLERILDLRVWLIGKEASIWMN